MHDYQFSQRANTGAPETQQHQDTLNSGKTGAEPHRQRSFQQEYRGNAIHQHTHGQPPQTGDSKQAHGQKLHRSLPYRQRPEAYMSCELLSNFISLTDRKQQIKKFILSKYCGDPSFRNILSNLHNFR